MPTHSPHLLQLHPSIAVGDEGSVSVSAAVMVTERVALTYSLPARGLRIPVGGERQRTMGLWEHTCLEFFVADKASEAYREFNFSPNGDWAAFDFSSYRAMCDAEPVIAPPGIMTQRKADCLEVTVQLSLESLPPGRALRCGLTAVLENATGQLSYWAMHHPAAAPDFHHPAGFVMELELTCNSD